MGYSFKVSYVLYPYDVWVTVNQSDKKIRKQLKNMLLDKFHPEIEELMCESQARTLLFSGGQTAIRFNVDPKERLDILVHEVFHAVHFLFERLNITLTLESCEAFAYAQQFLFSEIKRHLK